MIEQNNEYKQKNIQLNNELQKLKREIIKKEANNKKTQSEKNQLSSFREFKEIHKAKKKIEELSFIDFRRETDNSEIQDRSNSHNNTFEYITMVNSQYKQKLKMLQRDIIELKTVKNNLQTKNVELNNVLKIKESNEEKLHQKLQKSNSQILNFENQNKRLSEQISLNKLKYDELINQYTSTINQTNTDLITYQKEREAKNYQIELLSKNVVKLQSKINKLENEINVLTITIHQKNEEYFRQKNETLKQLQKINESNKSLERNLDEIQMQSQQKQNEKQQYEAIFVELLRELQYYKKSLQRYMKNHNLYQLQIQNIENHIESIKALEYNQYIL